MPTVCGGTDVVVGVVDMWVYGERCQNETFLSEGPVQ